MEDRSIQIEHKKQQPILFCLQEIFKYRDSDVFFNVYHGNINHQDAGDIDLTSAKIKQDLLTSFKIKD